MSLFEILSVGIPALQLVATVVFEVIKARKSKQQ